MSWRDELQFWPRPPIPEIGDIIQICGEELHDMLRGIVIPPDRCAMPRSGRSKPCGKTRLEKWRKNGPQSLKGKNILITGAARGMGAANARPSRQQGANVCLGDLDLDEAQKVADRINAPATARRLR
jgi:hypothetical protein